MANPNGRKGSLFETGVMKKLRELGAKVERLTKAGKNDEGDLCVVIAGKTYILELKDWAKWNLPQFWREATLEAANYAKARGLEQTPPCYVVVKRRNSGIEKAWVIQDLESWLADKNTL